MTRRWSECSQSVPSPHCDFIAERDGRSPSLWRSHSLRMQESWSLRAPSMLCFSRVLGREAPAHVRAGRGGDVRDDSRPRNSSGASWKSQGISPFSSRFWRLRYVAEPHSRPERPGFTRLSGWFGTSRSRYPPCRLGLAGLVADTRQAKRYFPVIAAGGVMGLVVWGVATAPLAATLGSSRTSCSYYRPFSSQAPPGLPAAGRREGHLPGASAGSGEGWRIRSHGRPYRCLESGLLRWMSMANLLVALVFSLLYLSLPRGWRWRDTPTRTSWPPSSASSSRAMAAAPPDFAPRHESVALRASVFLQPSFLVLPILYVVGFRYPPWRRAFRFCWPFASPRWPGTTEARTAPWEALINSFSADRGTAPESLFFGVPLQLGTILSAPGLVAFIAQRFGHPNILYGAGFVGAILAVASVMRSEARIRRIGRSLRARDAQ